MSSEDKPKDDMSSLTNKVVFGSERHAQMLRSGYKMNTKEAAAIVADYNKDGSTLPYDLYARAKSFQTALASKPQVTSAVKLSMG